MRQLLRLFKAPVFKSKGEELVWRSTGILGDFKMDIATMILIRGVVELENKDDVIRVLERYHDHVGHWNVPAETISLELSAFSTAVGMDSADVIKAFNKMSYPGIFVTNCGRLCCTTRPCDCKDCPDCILSSLEQIEE